MTMPSISGSTPQGGGVSLRCFGEGRLVLVFPLREETGHAFGKPSEPKQFMKCNVVALPDAQSAPFITFGGEMNNLGQMVKPDTMRIDVGPQGTLFENLSIGGGGMLYILRKALSAGQGRVGRLWKDQQYNGAWKLTEVADGTPDMAAATNWMSAFSTGNFTNMVAQPIPNVPQQAAPQQFNQQVPQGAWPVQNAAPQQAPAQGGWGPQVQQNTPPAQQGWGAPQQVAPQQAQQGWGQPPAQQQGWGAPQQVAPQQDPSMAQPTGF